MHTWLHYFWNFTITENKWKKCQNDEKFWDQAKIFILWLKDERSGNTDYRDIFYSIDIHLKSGNDTFQKYNIKYSNK